MPNGYTALCPVTIQAEAQMLESVAGYDEAGMHRELAFARRALDLNDVDTMRWLVCLLAREINAHDEALNAP